MKHAAGHRHDLQVLDAQLCGQLRQALRGRGRIEPTRIGDDAYALALAVAQNGAHALDQVGVVRHHGGIVHARDLRGAHGDF